MTINDKLKQGITVKELKQFLHPLPDHYTLKITRNMLVLITGTNVTLPDNHQVNKPKPTKGETTDEPPKPPRHKSPHRKSPRTPPTRHK
jgi:hypothetical protein